MAESQQADGATLDAEHRTGVWYDTATGDFVTLKENESGDVEVYSPEADVESHPPFFTIPKTDWENETEQNLYKVSDRAMTNPVLVYKETESTDYLPTAEYADYKWARRVTTIEQSDDYDPSDYR